MASSQVLSISSQSFISLVRDLSASKIKLCFPCGCNDIHINPTKCNLVLDTILKYLGSPNLYSQACAGSTWKGVARCPLRGVLEVSRFSHTGCEPHDFHTTTVDFSPLRQETHQCCACFHSPKAPAKALAPLPLAGHHSPAVSSTHHLSTASPPWSISGIRPQGFFSDLAKLQILDGFNLERGIWPDLLENGPSFIQTVLQTSTNRVWVLTFLWNLKPHVFHMV